MAYGHAERTLATIKRLEAETVDLLGGQDQLDAEQEQWLRETARPATRHVRASGAGPSSCRGPGPATANGSAVAVTGDPRLRSHGTTTRRQAGLPEQVGGGEPLHRLGIGAHRLGGLALSSQMQPERADLSLEALRIQRLRLVESELWCGHGIPLLACAPSAWIVA